MQIVHSLKAHEIQRVCQANFGEVRRIYTDASWSFNRLWRLGTQFQAVHAHDYTHGDVHTNRGENAWSPFKRGLVGMYHHVSAKLLQDYLDEFAFRYSHRREKGRMMDLVLAGC